MGRHVGPRHAIRELHEPFRDLNVALAPGERFDELREAHKRLRAKRDDVGATWRKWDERTLYKDVVGPFQETKLVRQRRYHPPNLTPAAELLPLSEFSSTNEFLQQAQRRYTSGVHHRNWLALAEAFVSKASQRGGAATLPKAGRLAGARTTSAGARRSVSSQSARRGLAPS